MEPAESLRATLGASWLSLLTSSSTLVCCALPALLVTLGAGASLVTLTSHVPQLIWLSEHKALVFGGAALALLLAGLAQWRARSLPCPADPAAARTCQRARRLSAGVYAASVALYAIGAFFAFVAPLWL
ncbi:MAG: hypothetical protein JNK71_00555 [Methyloversatilis sp.]|nr:hypothetical protein [Methyloversatilis sp.]